MREEQEHKLHSKHNYPSRKPLIDFDKEGHQTINQGSKLDVKF